MGYRVVHPVCSAVGKGGKGCSIKASGVPCSTPGVQCCGEGGEGCSVKAGQVRCSTRGV